MDVGAKFRDDRVERRLGHRMEIPVERRGLPRNREGAQNLSGIAPEICADLGEHHVALRHLPGERPLPRHATVGRSHAGDAEKVDQIGFAGGI